MVYPNSVTFGQILSMVDYKQFVHFSMIKDDFFHVLLMTVFVEVHLLQDSIVEIPHKPIKYGNA